MKRPLALLTCCFGLWLLPEPSHAQKHQGCYMLDHNGERVSLDRLCGNSPPIVSPTEVTPPTVFRAPIKRRQGGIPIIDVRFNNQQTVEMMVDTGASATLVSAEVAQQLGVEKEGTFIADTPSDKAVEFAAGRVDSISAGGAVAKDVVVVISPALSMGLLGQNFFGRYDMVIKEDVVEFRNRS